MCWEEGKVNWEVRMTSILGELEMAKVTPIPGRREYHVFSSTYL
jgi:hypothetical protein